MARGKKEENTGIEALMQGAELDVTPHEEVREEIPLHKEEPRVAPRTVVPQSYSDEPVNCLRNEKIIVRFVPSQTAMVQRKGHILSGGMAENATRSFVVPRLAKTGMFKNILTDSEKSFLEKAMGLEINALSIYKKENNFWDDSNPSGIGRVTLHKQDNYLDLSIPEQYIQYKILLANKDYIASSMEELEDRPKATYQFVLISEGDETKRSLSRMDITMECYTEYGAVKKDKDVLKVIIEQLEKRPISNNVKIDYLQNKINDYIQADPRKFYTVITDKYLLAKVLIRKAVEAGLVGTKNNTYYLRKDGSPLCEMGEESTLNNAAKYVSSIKHQELKYLLEAQLKEAAE
jgi:hypothetical protein